MNIFSRLKAWWRETGSLVRQDGCKECGWAEATHPVHFHNCTEQDRVSYWHRNYLMMANKVSADPNCPVCKGSGWLDQYTGLPYTPRPEHFSSSISHCRCKFEAVKKLSVPPREEEAGCSGATLLCEECWQKLSVEQIQAHYRNWLNSIPLGSGNNFRGSEIMTAVEKAKAPDGR